MAKPRDTEPRPGSTEFLKNAIFQAKDLGGKEVAVPEWGLETGLYIWTLTGAERLQYAAQLPKRDEIDVSVWTKLIVLAIRDQDGHRVFADADADKLARTKSGDVLLRLFNQICEHNGIGPRAEKAAIKNF